MKTNEKSKELLEEKYLSDKGKIFKMLREALGLTTKLAKELEQKIFQKVEQCVFVLEDAFIQDEISVYHEMIEDTLSVSSVKTKKMWLEKFKQEKNRLKKLEKKIKKRFKGEFVWNEKPVHKKIKIVYKYLALLSSVRLEYMKICRKMDNYQNRTAKIMTETNKRLRKEEKIIKDCLKHLQADCEK